MKVYLDDERPTPPGWVRAYTAPEAIALLATGDVDELSLDHDLGDSSAGTGYDVCLWLEEQVAHGDFELPSKISIHSANPIGRIRMQMALNKMRQIIEERE